MAGSSSHSGRIPWKLCVGSCLDQTQLNNCIPWWVYFLMTKKRKAKQSCNSFNLPTFRQEGVHLEIYKPIFVEVTTTEGEVLKCRCYQQITELEEDRRPSAVYKNVMVRGARENGVPEDYINNELITIIDNGYDGDVEVKLELEKRKLDWRWKIICICWYPSDTAPKSSNNSR